MEEASRHDTVILPSGQSYNVPDYEAIDGIRVPISALLMWWITPGNSKYNALQVSSAPQLGQLLRNRGLHTGEEYR